MQSYCLGILVTATLTLGLNGCGHSSALSTRGKNAYPSQTATAESPLPLLRVIDGYIYPADQVKNLGFLRSNWAPAPLPYNVTEVAVFFNGQFYLAVMKNDAYRFPKLMDAYRSGGFQRCDIYVVPKDGFVN